MELWHHVSDDSGSSTERYNNEIFKTLKLMKKYNVSKFRIKDKGYINRNKIINFKFNKSLPDMKDTLASLF